MALKVLNSSVCFCVILWRDQALFFYFKTNKAGANSALGMRNKSLKTMREYLIVMDIDPIIFPV
jgi:hypothetical protein